MPEEKPTPSKPAPDGSWRGAQSGSAGAARPGSRRRVQLTMLVGLFLALVTFAVVWIFFLQGGPPEPFFFTINIGDYNDARFPVVPFAKQDSQRLARHFENQRDPESKTKALLVKELADLAELPERKGRPTVVYISALALVRENKVHLLPIDANPDNASTWLPLETVLEAVGRCREPKLLILDLAHPLADPRLGVLEDRVAEQVEDHLKRNPPSFFVLCPCSAGQLSLTSEVLQAGVLAYYLDKGLQGAAVKRGQPGRTEEAITVQDLCAFAKVRVNHWAHVNRGQQQQPILFGEGKDFPLVNLQTRAELKEFKMPDRSYPKSLRDDWMSLDAWKKLGLAPAELREFETQLLRLEKRWQGGVEVGEARTEKAIRDARTEIEKIQGPFLAPLFLGTAVAQGRKDDSLVQDIKKILTDLAEKKKDPAKISEALKTKLAKKNDADNPQLALMEALAQLPELQEGQVRLALAAPDVLPKPDGANPGFVEAIYLQRLAVYADRLKDNSFPDRWPSVTVQRLFKTMLDREAVLEALSQNPSLLPLVRSQFEEADKDRQSAEKILLWQQEIKPSAWDDADKLFKKAKDNFDLANPLLDSLGFCQHELDEAALFLPGLVSLLTDWPEYDAAFLETWHEANSLTASLGQSFRDETAKFERDSQAMSLERLEHLKKEAQKLKGYVQSLKEKLHKRIDHVDQAAKRTGPDILEQVLCLRRCAVLPAEKRFLLNDRAAELAKTLQEKTDREDEENKDAELPGLPRDALKRVKVQKALFEPAGDFKPWQLNNVQRILIDRAKFLDWLEVRCQKEGAFWTADDLVISSFYSKFEERLSRLKR